MRRASHWSVIGPGRRGRVGPEARRPPSDHKPEALVERGGSLHLRFRSAGLAAGFLTLVLAAPAVAAPVTVTLRIEGPTRTLFEDPVSVDARTFHFSGDPVQHRCDGTAAENQGPSPTPTATRGGAVAQAIDAHGLVAHGSWSTSFGSPSFTDIAGEDVQFNSSTNEFLGEYKNEAFASFGSCGDPVASGDRVLFAYGDGSEQLLAMTGPSRARPGESVTVKVTDSSGTAVPGAKVGDATTGDDGTAAVGPLTQRGDNDLKATKDDAIRSNRVRVCVTDGADGACGTTVPGQPAAPPAPVARDTAAPAARIAGIRSGQRFKRKRAPRTLRGTASPDPSGLRAVKLSLTRSSGGRCQLYSPTQERFRPSRCGRRVNFSIGDRESWSYLLPKRLGKGRYVLDAIAVDKLGNRDRLARGRNRVVFFVR